MTEYQIDLIIWLVGIGWFGTIWLFLSILAANRDFRDWLKDWVRGNS